MAQTEEEKLQANLFGELEKNDVVVAKDKVEEMKENILKDKGSANYLGIGVHDVALMSVELIKAKTGTLGIQFNVANEEGQARHKAWLSEGALPYTIESVSRLMVHNAEAAKKEEAKTYMSNIVSAKALYDTIVETLKAREKTKKPFVGHLSIAPAKDGSTYKDKNGVERPSLETNFLPYRPKLSDAQIAATTNTGATKTDEPIDLSEIPF